MKTRVTLLLMACIAAAFAAEAPKTFPVGDGGRLFGNPDVETLLARPYRDDVPMACAGHALWAGHPGGWAFPEGTVHWYLLTPRGLGFDLQVLADNQPIGPASGTAYPSHVTGLAAGPVRIDSAKWISADDVFVTRLTFENGGSSAVDLTLNALMPADSVAEDGGHYVWTLNHAGVLLHNVALMPDFVFEPTEEQKLPVYMKEGEAADTRIGSKGPDKKPAASGGEVLGSNFGGQPGDNATWVIDVKEPIEDAALTIRYARATSGDADIAVQLPGRKRMEKRMFRPTGGWGETPAQFGTQMFPMGPIEAGPASVALFVLTANGNVNIDAVYIHDATAQPGASFNAKTRLARSFRLEPGARETLLCCVAVSPNRDEAAAALAGIVAHEDPLAAHVAEYTRWNVDNVPAFRSMDPALMKQYWHRATSILRKNLFHAAQGRLADWGVAEGRWTSSWYANMISYGGGHQVRETRWLRDPQYVHGIVSTWCANEKANGVFPNFIHVDEIGDGQYTDWIASTAWDAHLVHPNTDKLRAWAEALKRNVDGWLTTYDSDNDGLLLVDSHWWTGMEWQPSFFYFTGFDKDKQEQHLERVDLTAYVYGNARNLAEILDAIGDADGARKYGAIADRIRGAVMTAMWDDATQFFYSLEPKTHDKAMVKEVVGVYPFYFSMFGQTEGRRYVGAWRSILDPEEFWTTWPVASATKKCAAYSQDENFNGKRVGGCMWNGPTWPHANSIVLSAMAATLREHPESPLTADHLYELFRSFTMAQFKDQDLEYPWTGEYYNGDTGVWRTDQRDYNHSTYIDVLIADIAGLRPRNDDVIEVHPLVSAQMPPFMLDGIRYRGRDISIFWGPEASEETQPDGLKGFRVYVDGVLKKHSPTPERAEIK